MPNYTFFILSALIAAGIPGCVWPVPHMSERSPEVRGRVIDSATELPIEGATIALHGNPRIEARSDHAGVYRIRARHNLHLVTFLGPCSSEFPQGKYYGNKVDISHPNYESTQIQARDFGGPLRDIALVPLSKP
jgi:hypothetical protein